MEILDSMDEVKFYKLIDLPLTNKTEPYLLVGILHVKHKK